MSLYTLALFAHVSGAIGIFAGLGTWVFAVAALRRAQQVEQVRVLAALIHASGNLVVGSIVLLGIAGIYMALSVWGAQATWIIVATISFVLLAPFGALVIEPRVRRIATEAGQAPDGLLSAALEARTRDPLLAAGLVLYVSCLFGIVFLMTDKPPLMEAILAMGVALAVGVLASLPLWRSARTQARSSVGRRIVL